MTPRYKSHVWRATSEEERTKALPAGLTPPPPGSWSRVYAKLLLDVEDLVDELTAGKIGARRFIDDFDALLADSHAKSWYLGRYLAGDKREMGFGDVIVGRASADQDGYYLQGFLKSIENDQYLLEDGTWLDSQIKNRCSLYANKTRGTANESFTENSPADLNFKWTLGAVEHCPDCIDLSSMNPWESDEIYINPGDGSTACITNCRCVWVRSDGVRGFDPVH